MVEFCSWKTSAALPAFLPMSWTVLHDSCWALGLQQRDGQRDSGNSDLSLVTAVCLSRSQARKGLYKMKTIQLAAEAQHGVSVLLGLDLYCVSVLLPSVHTDIRQNKNILIGCLGTQSLDRIFCM